MEITIPESAIEIIRVLNEAGYEAFVVGGCVRDSLMGRIPMDWDITTSAKPEQVKSLFRRTVDTGIQHGTVTIMIHKEGFEVTTYRIDGEYEDSRHPKEVSFTSNLKEDLQRRDFTMNAMAYHPEIGLVDEFEGMEDLLKGRIRCVGRASERFEEDALRMLRAIRFAGQLNFEVEANTLEAIRIQAARIQKVSAERIRVELTKLLCSMAPERLLLASKVGLLAYVLPEFDQMLATTQNNPHHRYNVGEHVLCALKEIQKSYYQLRPTDPTYWEEKRFSMLVWSALLHDVAKPDCHTVGTDGNDHFIGHDKVGCQKAKRVLQRLKFDNETIDVVTRLVRWHDYRFEGKAPAHRKAMNAIGTELLPMLFLLEEADILAQSEYRQKEKLEHLTRVKQEINGILQKGEAVTIAQLAISGRDLIEQGMAPGKEIGVVLQQLLEHVWKHPQNNQRDILLKLANDLRK